MPIKMHQVSYFLALCEERSFTRAAKCCGVAQPSLTRAIQQLESDLGGRLFHRSHSHVHLTPFGTEVNPEFLRINDAAQKIAQIAARRQGGSDPVSTERSEKFIHPVAVAIFVIAIVAIGAVGLALHTTGSATASASGNSRTQSNSQVGSHVGSNGVHRKPSPGTIPFDQPQDLF